MANFACWAPLPRGSATEVGDAAKRLEARGYVGAIGNQIYGPPWATLAVAAASTSDLGIESGIAMSFTRSPFETACAALELDRLCGGRFILGLGTAPRAWTEAFFGEEFSPPVGRLREIIQIIRQVNDAAVEGAPMLPPFDGEHYRLSFDSLVPTFGDDVRRIPIWIASLRERLCELAGEVGDGLIGHPIWSEQWMFTRALPALERGATAAGRNVGDMHVQLWLTASIDDDPTVAARRARANVAFYAGIPSYRNYFDAHGFGDMTDALVEARASRPLADCVDLVPLEAARTFALCGTADDVGQRLEKLDAHSDSMCVKPPTWGLEPEETMEQHQRIEAVLLG